MASKYLQLFPIPNELPNIIRDLTREILRYQPQDIIQFCAAYFKARHLRMTFMWDEANPRAPRPSDYKVAPKRQTHDIPVEVEKKVEEVKPALKSQKGAMGNEIKEVKAEIKEVKAEIKHEVHAKRNSQENFNDLSVVSGGSSLPENHDEAANVYVNGLLDKVQKHMMAST